MSIPHFELKLVTTFLVSVFFLAVLSWAHDSMTEYFEKELKKEAKK